MSRVDEALKRAEAVPQRPASAGVAVVESAVERPRALSLEDYPREQRPARDFQPALRAVVPAASSADVHAVSFADPGSSQHIGKAYQGKLVGAGESHMSAVEQYRRLAATVHHLQLEQGLRRLMVSSSVPQEGKTLTVVNLAMTLSESYGRRVLLIDADLRRPSIHEVFGISNRFGLCDALRTEREELALSKVSSQLWVLPAGSAGGNPMTTLTSQRMERFLDEVGASFDWVLLDAPPAALMADAGLLARLTRAVILIIRAGSTPYTMVEKTVAELGREHIVGTLLNRVEGDAAQWSQYYGSYEHASHTGSTSPRVSETR